MQTYLTVVTLKINTVTNTKELWPRMIGCTKWRVTFNEAMDSGGFSTWEDVKGIFPEKAVKWLRDHDYDEVVCFFGEKVNDELIRMSQFMDKKTIMSKNPNKSGSWRLFRYYTEYEKAKGMNNLKGVEEPSKVPHLSCEYLSRPEHKTGIHILTPRVKPSVTAEYTNVFGRELLKKENMIFRSWFTKGGCEITERDHVCKIHPKDKRDKKCPDCSKYPELLGWEASGIDWIGDKPVGYREDLVPMLIKQGWPSENVLSRVIEDNIEIEVSMDIGGNTGFDSDTAKTNSLVYMSEGYHWRPANEEGLRALGMESVPEEHQDNNLDGNRLEDALEEANKEAPDWDKEKWGHLKEQAKEMAESTDGVKCTELMASRRSKVENPGATKVRLKKDPKSKIPGDMISRKEDIKLKKKIKDLQKKHPLIKRLVSIYKKYLEPYEAMLELMNERALFWHPGAEFHSGNMSGFIFEMRDERDELDDEMCAANYKRMLLEDLAFNRHKRDYMAKWDSNRSNWLKLVKGLEAQNLKVNVVTQTGSVTYGEVSWMYVDLDEKRTAKLNAHYKSKVGCVDPANTKEINRLLQVQKDARKRFHENPMCMQRVPVFGETVTVEEKATVVDRAVKAVSAFAGRPLERFMLQLHHNLQNQKSV